MAEAQWIKIVTDLFDDDKIILIEAMPDADSLLVIWLKLLCLAGKKNNKGIFRVGKVPYNDEMFATVFHRPINTIRLALDTFEKFGMIEIINDTVVLPNWEKHQSLDALEKKREYQKNLMRERRAAQKALIETNSKVNSEANCDTNCDANVSPLDKNRVEEIRQDKKRLDDKSSDSCPIDFVKLINAALDRGSRDLAVQYWNTAKSMGVTIDPNDIKKPLKEG